MARSSALADSLKQRRWQIIILLTMYLGYVGFMLCRNTLIASSVTMINDPNLQMDKESYGRLLAPVQVAAAEDLRTSPGSHVSRR